MHGEMGEYTGELHSEKGYTYGEGTFVIPTGKKYLRLGTFRSNKGFGLGK